MAQRVRQTVHGVARQDGETVEQRGMHRWSISSGRPPEAGSTGRDAATKSLAAAPRKKSNRTKVSITIGAVAVDGTVAG